MYRSQVLGADDYNTNRLMRRGLQAFANYLGQRRNKELMMENAEIHHV